MKPNESKKSRIAALRQYVRNHPFTAAAIGSAGAALVGLIINVLIVVWRYRSHIFMNATALALAAMFAVLPVLDLKAAQGSGGETADTNVYAAVFIMPVPPGTAINDAPSAPRLSFRLTVTNGQAAAWMQGPALEQLPPDFDSCALSNMLCRTYGITMLTNGYSSQGGYLYSSFGRNGQSVSNIPGITYDSSSGGFVVSNSPTLYTVVLMRGTAPAGQWSPVTAARIPAGYTVRFTDDDAPPGAGYYRVAVQAGATLADAVAAAEKADPDVFLPAECMVAVVVIVVGTVVTVKLYHLCKKLFPPPPTNSYSPTNND